MYILSWIFYLAGILPDVKGWFIVIGVVFLLWPVALFIGKIWDEDFNDSCGTIQNQKIFNKGKFAIGIALIFFATIIPSEQSLYYIVGTQLSGEVINDPDNSQIINKMKERIIRELDSDTIRKSEN